MSRLVITFLPSSKSLLISRLQSPSVVILKPRKIKSATVSTVSPSICHEVMGPDAMILVFWMLSFKPTFSLSCFIFIPKKLLFNLEEEVLEIVKIELLFYQRALIDFTSPKERKTASRSCRIFSITVKAFWIFWDTNFSVGCERWFKSVFGWYLKTEEIFFYLRYFCFRLEALLKIFSMTLGCNSKSRLYAIQL